MFDKKKLALLLQDKRQQGADISKKRLPSRKLKELTSKPQLLDYYLVKEIQGGVLPRGYRKRVLKNLAEHHDIRLSVRNVTQRVTRVLAGNPLRPCADVNGTPSSREGKDKNYAGFLSLVDVHIPDRYFRRYIGLPANQLDAIAAKIGGDVVAVERDPKRAKDLQQLNKLVNQRRSQFEGEVKVLCDDIFNVMQSWKGHNFNVIDLDLMCGLPEDSLPWVKAIYHCADRGNVLVHVTTVGARVISGEQYETNLARFNRNLVGVGFVAVGSSSDRYWDRITPMRCERYLLSKTGI